MQLSTTMTTVEATGSGETRLQEALRRQPTTAEINEILITYPEDAKIKDECQLLPLHIAIIENCPDDVVLLVLNAFPEAAQVSASGSLPLHFCAAHSTSVVVFGALMDAFPQGIGILNPMDNLPVHVIVSSNHDSVELVEAFCAATGPEALLIKDKFGAHPLHLAVRNEAPTDVVLALLKVCPDAAKVEDNLGELALHIACMINCSFDVIQALVNIYPEAVTKENNEGSLPLHLALVIRTTTVPILTLLTENHPEGLLHADKNGRLPIHACCNNNQNSSDILCFMIKVSGPEGLKAQSKNGFCPLHFAIYHAHKAEVIQALIDAYSTALQQSDLEGNLPLHLCVENNKSSIETLNSIIQAYPAALQSKNKAGMLPIHCAAYTNSQVFVSSVLIDKGGCETLRARDGLGRLPLHSAVCECSSFDVVNCILEEYPEAAQAKDYMGYVPLHAAAEYNTSADIYKLLLRAYPGAAAEQNHAGELPLLVAISSNYKSTLEGLFELINANPEAIHRVDGNNIPISVRLIKGANYSKRSKRNFFDELCAKYPKNVIYVLSCCSRPVSVLQNIMPRIIDHIEMLFNDQDITVLFVLTDFLNALSRTVKISGAEALHVKAMIPVFERLMASVFNSASMNDSNNVVSILLKKHKKLDDHRGRSQQTIRWSQTLHMGLLGRCVRSDIKVLFPCAQVSMIIDSIFYDHLGDDDVQVFPTGVLWRCSNRDGTRIPRLLAHSDMREYGLLSVNLRSCPVAMFVLEGLSKLMTLTLITVLSIQCYGYSNEGDAQCSRWSNLLIAMWASSVLYEIGQLAEGEWDMAEYFTSMWNRFDFLTMSGVFAWAFLHLFTTKDAYARVCLAISAIPCSVTLLEYLSLKKTLGVLVISVGEMTYDLMNFFVVLFVASIGFGVTFYGLFQQTGNMEFQNSAKISMFLFQAAVGGFDFALFNESPYAVMGYIMLALYITLTLIVLLNLVIAVMSTTYERISGDAAQEWSFLKAESTRSFMLLQERHPFCMMPAPFNMVTVALCPIHIWGISTYNTDAFLPKNVSIAGTASNIVLVLVGATLRVVCIILNYLPSSRASFSGALRVIFGEWPRMLLLILHTIFVVPWSCRKALVVYCVDQKLKKTSLTQPYIDYRQGEKRKERRRRKESILESSQHTIFSRMGGGGSGALLNNNNRSGSDQSVSGSGSGSVLHSATTSAMASRRTSARRVSFDAANYYKSSRSSNSPTTSNNNSIKNIEFSSGSIITNSAGSSSSSSAEGQRSSSSSSSNSNPSEAREASETTVAAAVAAAVASSSSSSLSLEVLPSADEDSHQPAVLNSTSLLASSSPYRTLKSPLLQLQGPRVPLQLSSPAVPANKNSSTDAKQLKQLKRVVNENSSAIISCRADDDEDYDDDDDIDNTNDRREDDDDEEEDNDEDDNDNDDDDCSNFGESSSPKKYPGDGSSSLPSFYIPVPTTTTATTSSSSVSISGGISGGVNAHVAGTSTTDDDDEEEEDGSLTTAARSGILPALDEKDKLARSLSYRAYPVRSPAAASSSSTSVSGNINNNSTTANGTSMNSSVESSNNNSAYSSPSFSRSSSLKQGSRRVSDEDDNSSSSFPAGGDADAFFSAMQILRSSAPGGASGPPILFTPMDVRKMMTPVRQQLLNEERVDVKMNEMKNTMSDLETQLGDCQQMLKLVLRKLEQQQ